MPIPNAILISSVPLYSVEYSFLNRYTIPNVPAVSNSGLYVLNSIPNSGKLLNARISCLSTTYEFKLFDLGLFLPNTIDEIYYAGVNPFAPTGINKHYDDAIIESRYDNKDFPKLEKLYIWINNLDAIPTGIVSFELAVQRLETVFPWSPNYP